MTGGLQVQAYETYRALAAQGNDLRVEWFNWSERKPLPDLYHFIGFPHHLHRIAELVRHADRPYVCTLLLGSSRKGPQTWLAAMRHRLKAAVLRKRSSHDAVA